MAKFELKGKYTDGTDWTAGTFDVPTSLPNYMSLKKPTSISINESGNERTVTGVAEFESGGAMESGEYHQVLPSELIFVNLGTIFNVVVGNNVVITSTSLNRKPVLREKCFFITQSPTGDKEAWVGIAHEVLDQATSFQVLTKVVIDSVKKYAHNITIETGNAVIGFTIFTSHPNAYPNAFSVYANIGLSANQQIPASGVIGNNLPVYCIRMGVSGLAAIAVGMSVTLDSDTEVKDIVVPL